MNDPARRLTQLSQCAGCAAKLRPAELAQVLRLLKPRKHDPAALVGFGTNDDAAVYQLSPTIAVVETVDFFPPVVDDAFDFGQIAAANAISDIYAMGARPLFALNLVGFPRELGLATLSRILAGGQAKADEAGIPVLGGHSIQDAEPKYGMAVTGLVHPKRILTNVGAKIGDALILTKPLGSGIATTAIKRSLASPSLRRHAVAVMATLNRKAGEVFASRKFRVNALTDVTGFGLLGHLLEMLRPGKLRARLDLASIPFLPGLGPLATQAVVPGGTKANLEHAAPHVRFPPALPLPARWLLSDAQTNGGLLAAVPRRSAATALKALARVGVKGSVVGEVVQGAMGVDVVAEEAWLLRWPNIPGARGAELR